MPVGCGCRGGGRSRRGRAAVLVVEHRSRRVVAARVAGCGGPGAASSSESDRGCGERGRLSGCVVVSRRRCPTAHRTHGHSHCYSQRHAHHSLPHEQPQPGTNGAPPRAPPLRHDNHNLDQRTPSQPASPPTPATTAATRATPRVEAPTKLLNELQRRRPRPDATQLRIQHSPAPLTSHIERVFR